MMKKLDGWQIPLGGLTVLIMVGVIHELLGWMEAYPILTASIIAGSVTVSVGLITYRGVKLTLKEATKRMHAELEHSRDEAEKERQYAANKAHNERIATMRREVYLEAVAELVRAQSHLGGLAKLDLSKVDIFAGLRDFHIVVSKVAVVAEVDTVMKARAISTKFSTIVLQGAQILIPAIQSKALAVVHEKFHDDVHRELSRINAAMIRHNETRQTTPEDQAAFAALQRSHRSQLELAGTEAAKMVEAKQSVAAVEMKYAEMLRGELQALITDLDDLLSAVRLELGLATNRAGFAAQTNELFGQINNVADKVVKQSAAVIEQNGKH